MTDDNRTDGRTGQTEGLDGTKKVDGAPAAGSTENSGNGRGDDILDLVSGLSRKKTRGSSIWRKLGYGLAVLGAGGLFFGGMYAKDPVINALTSAKDTVVEAVSDANEWAYERLHTNPNERAVDFGISLSAYSHKLPEYEAAIFSVVDKAAGVSSPAQLESLTRTTFDKMSIEQKKAFA